MVSRAERSRDTKAELAEPEDGGSPVAVGRAEEPGTAAKGTTAEHPVATHRARPGRAIRWHADIAVPLAHAIFHPFIDIAVNLIKAKRVWFERIDR